MVATSMRGWGLKIQVGMTYVYVMSRPFYWERVTDRTSPRLYGLGLWITKDEWVCDPE